jgi:hypothetical protein
MAPVQMHGSTPQVMQHVPMIAAVLRTMPRGVRPCRSPLGTAASIALDAGGVSVVHASDGYRRLLTLLPVLGLHRHACRRARWGRRCWTESPPAHHDFPPRTERCICTRCHIPGPSPPSISVVCTRIASRSPLYRRRPDGSPHTGHRVFGTSKERRNPTVPSSFLANVRPSSAPHALPRGPVQGPAQPDGHLPRDRSGCLLRWAGLLDDPQRPDTDANHRPAPRTTSASPCRVCRRRRSR